MFNYQTVLILFSLYNLLALNESTANPSPNFCSFFNNRSPAKQPNLRNCTWFRDNSCCLQHEIDVTFARLKPLKGSNEDCQRYTNFLMCYICSPHQNTFYRKESLTVCEPFCDLFYNACKSAILKGTQVLNLYQDGREFCLSRRFLIGTDSCFDINSTVSRLQAISLALPISHSFINSIIIFSFILVFLKNVWNILLMK